MYERILVPTDGSALSKKAVISAMELAVTVGAELVAMHVVPGYPRSYLEGSRNVSMQEESRVEQAWTEKAQEMVDKVKQKAESRGIKASTTLVHSDLIGESVIKAATKHKCDLVVMASHGRKGLKRVLLGSETQYVLTHSTIPVLVLR